MYRVKERFITIHLSNAPSILLYRLLPIPHPLLMNPRREFIIPSKIPTYALCYIT